LAAESAAFRTLGVGASVTLGSAPQDKLTINASSQFNAPITVGQNALTIDTSGNIKTQGSAEIAGNLITGGLSEFKSPLTITSTSTPQLSIRYDELNKLDISVFSTGAVNVSSTATTTLFAAGNANQLVLGSNGNIGIGTTTPPYKLTVNGDLYVSATSTFGSATSTPVIFGGYVQSNIIPYFDNQYTLGLSNYRWANIYAATGTFGGTITIGTNTIEGSATTTLFTTGNANQLVLGANGNVGIGTATPSQNLDVQGGNINTSGSLMTGGTARIDSSGNLTNIGTISSTYLVTGASYVNLTNSAELRVGGITVLTSGRALQNLTGIVSSGTIQFTGLTANRLVATDGSSNLTTTISSANLAASVTDETGTGYLVFSNSPSISSPTLSGTISGTYTIGGTPTLASSLTGSGSPNITGIGLLSATNLTISGTATTTNLNVTGLTNLATTTISTQLSVPLITSPSTLTISPSLNATTTITGPVILASQTGNVGIGTTAPSQKLTVVGNIGIQAALGHWIIMP